ncbi:MAG: radical SAM protein [Spirochaetes bacterium]|nr:MAG: radical SAM protein [Spirochaetota bacterium]
MKSRKNLKNRYPSYLNIQDFKPIIRELKSMLNPCVVCPRNCRIDRFTSKKGICRTGYLPIVASYNLHHGEEPPISGFRGSGTIFFSGCPLRCLFCQNYPISQYVNGNEISIKKLAEYMLFLQRKGAHNINLVTPTHVVPQFVEALEIAVEDGLHIPIVYNCGGYENIEVLKILDGIIDIYLPDMKYGSNINALKYSGVKNYVEINRKAVIEMYRQVGDLVVDDNGVALRGLIIRHLVLPENISGTDEVLKFIAGLSRTIYISIMSQYFPAYKAPEIAELSRRLTISEYKWATELMEKLGLINGWIQPF